MELAPPSVSLAEYDQAFTRRRRQLVIAHVPVVVTVAMGVWIRSGFIVAAVAVAAVLAAEFALVGGVVAHGRRREDRRRLDGDAPAWAALATRSAIRGARSLASADSRVIGDVRGHLRHTGKGFEWSAEPDASAPSAAGRHISWPADATVSVYRTWGVRQPGLVRLTTADGRDDILVVSRTGDLVRHLHTLGGPAATPPAAEPALLAA